MGKLSRQDAEAVDIKSNGNGNIKKAIVAGETTIDPTLALLFASSAGPVKAPPRARYEEPPPTRKRPIPDAESEQESEEDEEEADSDCNDLDLSSIDGDIEDADIAGLSEDLKESEPELDQLAEFSNNKPERKRKRKVQEEDLEGKYMEKLAKEEQKEEEERRAERRLKRQRLMAEQDPDMSVEDEDVNEDGDAQDSDEEMDLDDECEDEHNSAARAAPSNVPLHESLAPSKGSVEIEKASRTVFLANVSTLAISSKTAKKALMAHMASFLPSLAEPPEGKPAHKVESIRFRSTAYAGTSLPKKAAFAKKELMAATTKSTNAYVVYSTAFAAREAVKKLNGTIVLDRHLRVDGVAHPTKTDHRRCVFVGNLGFVDDESMLDQGGENERKRSKIPSDIEEGLWRQFGKAGTVESVRVVRDEKTRVGKGFAYVQFQDANAVEAALLFNEKKYPPMLPRILRVVRAKAVRKTALASQATKTAHSHSNSKNAKNANHKRIYNPKLSSEQSSLQGRAAKLLGRAGAAQFRKREVASSPNGADIRRRGNKGAAGIDGIAKTPESIVFEGFRASSKSGKPRDLKMGGGGGGKKKGKPRNKSSKRSSEWKKTGRKGK